MNNSSNMMSQIQPTATWNGYSADDNFTSVEPDSFNATSNETRSDGYAVGATIISPITMCLAGFVGNLLALVVLQKTKTEIRRMMFYTLVAGLACTDLTGIALTSPVTIAAYINRREMPGGVGLCKFNAFIMVCFGLATPLIVCAMAVERFLAIKCTYFYSKYCTPQNARITVVILWACVFLFGALPLFGFGDYSLQYPHTWCFLNFQTREPLFAAYGYMYAAVNLGIVVLMTYCNVFVMISLLRVRYIRQEQGRNSISNSLLHDSFNETKRLQAQVKKQKQNDVEMQMIWLMCAITTIFAVCWAPLMIHIIITLATSKANPVFGLLAIRLASLNQTLDPWLYILLRKAFLKRVKNNIKRLFCTRRPKKEVSECKCRQYVHVRRQLCHMNYYVGNTDPDNSAGRHSSDEVHRSRAQLRQHGSSSLPDVMRNTYSGKRDSMPDVTKSRGMGAQVLNGAYEDSSNSEGLDSESPEGIYVDIFRLVPPLIEARSESSVDNEIEEDSCPNHTSDAILSNREDESEVFVHDCSTSGIFSLTPSNPNEIVDERILHSDITPIAPAYDKQNARRTKSYT